MKTTTLIKGIWWNGWRGYR